MVNGAEGADGGLLPVAFTARTVHVYVSPPDSWITVIGEATAPPPRVLPPVLLTQVAVKTPIAEPPSKAGGLNDTHAVDPTVVTVTPVGTVGRPGPVVNTADRADGGPVPTRFAARTTQ